MFNVLKLCNGRIVVYDSSTTNMCRVGIFVSSNNEINVKKINNINIDLFRICSDVSTKKKKKKGVSAQPKKTDTQPYCTIFLIPLLKNFRKFSQKY